MGLWRTWIPHQSTGSTVSRKQDLNTHREVAGGHGYIQTSHDFTPLCLSPLDARELSENGLGCSFLSRPRIQKELLGVHWGKVSLDRHVSSLCTQANNSFHWPELKGPYSRPLDTEGCKKVILMQTA